MPVNPVEIRNPYGLPSLAGSDLLTEEERRNLAAHLGGGAPTQSVDPREQMRQDLVRQANEISQGRVGASRSAFSIADTVPISEWKPASHPLPISKKDQVKTVLDSRERQLRSLEKFASDPKNPASQDEVERIRGQIEAEAQRALSQSTLPSPVAMYEQLVEDESPEIYRAKHKEMLQSLPGFNEKWMSAVSFDPETNEPKYPKWMEQPLEAAMAKAMGVGDDKAAVETAKAAESFAIEQLKRQKPDLKQYGDDTKAFDEDTAVWESKMQAHFQRFNPEAAKLLPTYAEEQGFVAPPATTQTAGPSGIPASPTFNADEVEQLRIRFEANEVPTTIAKSADELRDQITKGDVSPGDVVIVSTPSGAVAMKLQSGGKFRQVGRFSSQQ